MTRSHKNAGINIWGCDPMHMPLHTPKTLEMCKKKACLVWFKELQGVQQFACLKQQRFWSFTFYITERYYEKKMYLFIFYFVGSVVKITLYILLFSSNKEWQTLKELKRKINDWTIVFLMSLLIVLTWKILLLFSFWYKIISCFK